MKRFDGGSAPTRKVVFLAALVILIAWSVASNSVQLPRGPKVVLSGHGSEVRSVVFSPDGKMVASGSQDHTVKLWNPETGELLRTVTEHAGDKNSIAFSPDGGTLAISNVDNSVNLYESGSGKLARTLAGSEIAGPSAFSPDGRLLVTKSLPEKGNLKIWDVHTGKLVQSFNGHGGDVIALAFSPRDSLIASIGSDKSLKVWEPEAGKLVVNLTATLTLVDVAFSPDGETIASADDVTIKLWDARTGKLKTEIHSDIPSRNFQPPVRSIVFSPNGGLLAVSSYDHVFTLLDVGTGKAKYNFDQDSQPYSAAFSPDGNTVVTACQPKALYFWNLETAELKLKIGTEAASYAVAFSPDGKTIASDAGFFDRAVSVWDAQTGILMRQLTGHDSAIMILVFSPDGRKLCGAQSDTAVRIWDMDSGELLHTVEIAEASEVSSIAFSPDGKVLAVAGGHGDGTIRLVDTQTWLLKRTLLASSTIREENPLTRKIDLVRLGLVSAQFSPDGKTLAAIVDEGKALKLWNAQTGLLVRSMPLKEDMSSCDFSPDLKLIACGLGLWNTAGGVLVKTLPGTKGASLAFSDDSKFLATTGEFGGSAKNYLAVKVWDVQTGKLKSTLNGHTNAVSSAAFSPDGQTLLTGSSDGTVRLWNTNTGDQKQVLLIEDPPRLGP